MMDEDEFLYVGYPDDLEARERTHNERRGGSIGSPAASANRSAERVPALERAGSVIRSGCPSELI